MIGLFGVALGAEMRLGLELGPEAVLNDPFLYRFGARAGVSLGIGERVEVGTNVVYFPFHESGERTPWIRTGSLGLLDAAKLLPWTTSLGSSWHTVVRVRGLRYEAQAWSFGLGAHAGFALSQLVQDPTAFEGGVEGGDEAASPRFLPGAVYGLFWDARWRKVGVRMRLEEVLMIEAAPVSVGQRHRLFGAEAVVWL